LSIAEIALDSSIDVYDWVKYIYIDDPISSLDEPNTVRVACQLAEIFRDANPKIGVVISTHHTLFFNVLFNELKQYKTKQYFLHRSALKSDYLLAPTHDTPFMQHVAQLAELRQITEDGQLYTHHFNALRSIMERTATFLGYHDFSVCLKGFGDEGLAARALNLLSHGSYSIYEPSKMQDDNKKLFKEILDHFMSIYSFALPDVFVEAQTAPETT
jgi:wobble nucleotide-excising tRNase